MPLLYLALAFSLNAAANVLLKIGAGKGLSLSGSPVALLTSNWQTLLGLGLFAANVIFYFLALRALPLSVAYPIMVAMSFILINGYAIFMLNESVTPLQYLGYVLIVFGLTCVVIRTV